MIDFEKMIDKVVKKAMVIVDRDINIATRDANNKLEKEAINMYRKYIHDYYLYKTKSYIRHWEGVPGTREGQNLYEGMDIRKINGDKQKLSIYMPYDQGYQIGSEMADDYKDGTPAKDVLENVVYGNRGIPGKWEEYWTGEYNGTYFSYKGKMNGAFETFNLYFDDIAKEIINNNLKKMGY